ncbi:CoA-transferase family III [Azotobacter vinelandii]|nr:CoA-transferase family III [Azotobacter vinelandii]
MSGALSPRRVLDLSSVLVDPWAGRILAGFGAEALKVERPGTGDNTRHWGPQFLRDINGENTSEAANYPRANRSKKSLIFGFKSEGQRIIRDLAAQSDTLPESFKVDRRPPSDPLGGLSAPGTSKENHP